MNIAQIKDNKIINMVFIDSAEIPEGFCAVSDGKWIGDRFDDTLTNAELMDENRLLSAQIKAATESNSFLEECIVEMAGIVYAG